MGYARAGFDVTGVDVVRHKRNPHPVIEADALSLDPAWIASNFDAVHASPMCQGYSAMRHAKGARGAPLLISPTRDLLAKTGLPYVIENVEDAAWDMRSPLTLCGASFVLGTFAFLGFACAAASNYPAWAVWSLFAASAVLFALCAALEG
jgi:DNA (cytosine-5)-methyltransferase 1